MRNYNHEASLNIIFSSCYDPFGSKMIGTGIHNYDHSLESLQLHYRQFLVALVFADLPSLSPFIS